MEKRVETLTTHAAKDMFSRREFLRKAAMLSVAGAVAPIMAAEESPEEDAIAAWDRETELVSPADFAAYRRDGRTRGFASLEKLEAAFAKVMREVKETVVTGNVPAVWSVYNMGYIVKTRESLFSIDLYHRRAVEFVPMLDFALVTHNHGDHWRPDLWLFFPGCGIDTAEAVAKVNAKRIVFGHLWELGHKQGHRGRLDERLIRPRLVWAKEAGCKDVSVAFWGDRIS